MCMYILKIIYDYVHHHNICYILIFNFSSHSMHKHKICYSDYRKEYKWWNNGGCRDKGEKSRRQGKYDKTLFSAWQFAEHFH